MGLAVEQSQAAELRWMKWMKKSVRHVTRRGPLLLSVALGLVFALVGLIVSPIASFVLGVVGVVLGQLLPATKHIYEKVEHGPR